MKSKIALVLCITQLCMLHSVEATTQKRVKTKVAQKSTLFKKIGSAVVIGAVGSAIALMHKQNTQETIPTTNIYMPPSPTKFQLIYLGWTGINGPNPSDNRICTLIDSSSCSGLTNDTFVQNIDLAPWMDVLKMNAVDAKNFIGSVYRNDGVSGFTLPVIKKDMTMSETLKLFNRLEQTDPMKRICLLYTSPSPRD